MTIEQPVKGGKMVAFYSESILDDSAIEAMEINIKKFTPQEIEDFFNSKND